MLMLPSEKQAENRMVESRLNLSDLSIGLPVILVQHARLKPADLTSVPKLYKLYRDSGNCERGA
jgi:hypothetical protein